MKIQIIIGTTRPNRFSEKAARWIFSEAKKIKDWEVELLDLRDYPLPFFNDPISPSRVSNGQYANEIARTWAKKISGGDAYIIVTAEYNHGYPAVLKNALDYIFKEWQRKPVGFVAYGNAGGARAVEQLRQVVAELEMVSIRTAIHIPGPIFIAIKTGQAKEGENPFAPLHEKSEIFLNELAWWANALKSARVSG